MYNKLGRKIYIILQHHRKGYNFMKGKKLLSFMLIMVLTLQSVTPIYSKADNTKNAYFRNQLTDDALVFYNAIQKMYEDGILQSGTESFDLTTSGFLTQAKIASYIDNEDMSAGSLLSDFGAARDAFWADYPSVFYVDFSNLSIRVTTDASSKYHVYIGTGRTDNYFTQGFSSKSEVEKAMKEYDTVVSSIATSAKTVAPRIGQSKEAAMVEYVHDVLTNSVSYHLEDTCQPENRGFIRTAYGALIKHEGVCEAYTRAFKAVMDELGIPCVMVNGVYLHNPDTPEAHIWDYVQLDGKWYGVDATMDDPYTKKPVTSTGVDGYENHEYLLRGDLMMGQKHVPIGIMSSADYEFSYPTLCIEDYGVEVITRDNGFSVSFKQDGKTDDGLEAAGEFYISYNDMGCAKARAAGYWFLERFWEPDEDGNLIPGEWHYILTDVYNLDDHDTYLHLSYPQVEFVEFAVTEVAPGPYLEDPYTYMWYVGDPGGIGPQSGMIYNANSGYKAPPYPKRVTPVQNVMMVIKNQTYHIEIEYDDDLKLKSEDSQVGIDLLCKQYEGMKLKNHPSGVKNSKIENIKWDGARNISFDFTPSEMFADDSVFYWFFVTGLVGVSSNKEPVEISYGAAHTASYCSLGVGGFNWKVFGQPYIMDDSDLSVSDWEMRDGTKASDLLSNRLVLVSSSTTKAQEDIMNGLIEDSGESLVSSKTYNISLTLCRGCVANLKDGESIRVSVGFPEGYGPEDEGVTFKAYHFIKDAAGNTVGVEEIPCTITKYGLIIECHSFSPFAVAVIEDDGTSIERSVVLSGTTGGTVTSDKGTIISLKPGETATVTVSADTGYVIDTLNVFNETTAEFTGKTSYAFEVSYDELTDNNIIDVRFMPQTIHKENVNNGETTVVIQEPAYHEHEYGDYITDEEGHYRICNICGHEEAKSEHTGGSADCTTKAVCEVCDTSYGDTNKNVHQGNTIVKNKKDATEFAEGYTGDIVCENCDSVITPGKTIDKIQSTEEKPAQPQEKDEGTTETGTTEQVSKSPSVKISSIKAKGKTVTIKWKLSNAKKKQIKKAQIKVSSKKSMSKAKTYTLSKKQAQKLQYKLTIKSANTKKKTTCYFKVRLKVNDKWTQWSNKVSKTIK